MSQTLGSQPADAPIESLPYREKFTFDPDLTAKYQAVIVSGTNSQMGERLVELNEKVFRFNGTDEELRNLQLALIQRAKKIPSDELPVVNAQHALEVLFPVASLAEALGYTVEESPSSPMIRGLPSIGPYYDGYPSYEHNGKITLPHHILPHMDAINNPRFLDSIPQLVGVPRNEASMVKALNESDRFVGVKYTSPFFKYESIYFHQVKFIPQLTDYYTSFTDIAVDDMSELLFVIPTQLLA